MLAVGQAAFKARLDCISSLICSKNNNVDSLEHDDNDDSGLNLQICCAAWGWRAARGDGHMLVTAEKAVEQRARRVGARVC